MGFMDKIQKFLPERFRKKKDPSEGLKENRLKEKENISRLKNDITGYSCVIAFGRSAGIAAELMSSEQGFENVSFITSRHLSFLSLNSSIREDINGCPIERGSQDGTYKRLEVVAAQILSQL